MVQEDQNSNKKPNEPELESIPVETFGAFDDT